jgi:uncharacterized protein (TIGR03083 family)
MSDVSYGDALIEQNHQLGRLFRDADWSTPVPTCPGWTVLQVLRHVGRGDRWAAQILREGGDGDVDPRQVPDGRPPDDVQGAIEWFSAGPRALLDAVTSVGPSTPVWTFVGPRPAEWWIRRRLHEATVHRADVALAVGLRYELEPWLAADGISEWLSLVDFLQSSNGGSDSGETLELQATDGESAASAWSIGSPGSSPNVALRGRSADLLLALTGRRRPEEADLVVTGDQEQWDRWLSRTTF